MNDSHIMGLTTLREAIAQAAPGETIDFDPLILSGGPVTIQLSNLGQLAVSKSVTINGPGANLLTIKAYDPTPATANGDGTRVLNIDDGTSGLIDVNISGLTLTGGDVSGKGGAVLSVENLTLADSVLTGNSTSDVDGNSGGAIFSDGGMTTVERTTLSANHAGDGGGAIFQHNGAVVITDSLLQDNSARYSGGAIFSDVAALSAVNSTFSANAAGYAGGGIFNRNGTATLDHVTITANSALVGAGSGIGCVGNQLTHTNVHSTIVAGNADYSDLDFLLGEVNPFLSQGYNVVGGGMGAGVFAAAGDQRGVYDPLVMPLADNGGPTLTHGLYLGSPAIDSGDPAETAGVGGVPLYDQRGASFTRVFADRIDVGAYERQPPAQTFVVDTLVDENDGNYSTGDLSLREAIALANASAGTADWIEFGPALSGTIYLTLGELAITDTVTIAGPGAGLLTIDAQNSSRIFFFDSPAGDFEIAGLTLTHGEAVHTPGTFAGGGAIRSRSADNLIVARSTISGNGSVTCSGGGIYAIGAVALVESTVSGNNASYGLGGGICSTGNVSLFGSTVSGNSTSDYYSSGGGIAAVIVTLTDSIVSGNSTYGGFESPGGGILAQGATLIRSTLSANRTFGERSSGGGMFASGDVTLIESTVSGNYTLNHLAYGGGIAAISHVTLTRSAVTQNSTFGDAAFGGGIRANGVTLTDSTISGNSTSGVDSSGGGISASFGGVSLTNSTVSGNSTSGDYAHGGGISLFTNYGGTVLLNETTVSGNSTSGDFAPGGGVYAGPRQTYGYGGTNGVGDVTIVQSTVTDNHATGETPYSTHVSKYRGAGGVVAGRDLTILGSIVAGNTASQGNPDVTPGQSTPTVNYSLIGNTSNLTATELAALIAGSGNIPNVSPQLAPLADNGGPTQTHALLAGSPAIDAGDPADVAGVGDVPVNDQRGTPFTRVYNGRIDMGAYERQTLAPLSLVVSTLADENDSDYSAHDLSLREAIYLANENYGTSDTISFSPTLNGGTIALGLGELVITDPVSINGPGASLLTIRADDPTPATQNGDGARIFNIDDGTATQQPVLISGLTLTGGDVDSKGGAILSAENLTVVDSTITDNATSDVNGNSGGAIYNSGGTLSVNRTILSNNHAGDGGGAIFNLTGSATIANSLFEQNSTRFSGGGIFNDSGFTKVSDSTFSSNSAGYAGGGVFTRNDVASFYNVTITGNVAPAGNGSGVASQGNGTTATNVTMSIVAANANDDDVALVLGATPTFFSGAYNLVGGGNALNAFSNVGDQTGITNPLLGPLADNGGPTLTHALLPGSPAIDAGDPAAVAGVGGVQLYDQRQVPYTRVYDGDGVGGARIDIGAFEVQSPLLLGDYNENNIVDAADYAVWRDILEAGGTVLPNDLTPGVVDESDFLFWRAHYGDTMSPGSGAGQAVAALESPDVVAEVSAPQTDASPTTELPPSEVAAQVTAVPSEPIAVFLASSPELFLIHSDRSVRYVRRSAASDEAEAESIRAHALLAFLADRPGKGHSLDTHVAEEWADDWGPGEQFKHEHGPQAESVDAYFGQLRDHQLRHRI